MIKLRGTDCWGSGAYGASRGDRTHKGVDVVASPNQPIKSLTYGTVSRLGWCYDWGKYPTRRHLRLVVVELDGNEFTYMYCSPSVCRGDAVKPGTILGTGQNLQPHFKGITPHFHFEIKTPVGNANPADMIPAIAEAVDENKNNSDNSDPNGVPK